MKPLRPSTRRIALAFALTAALGALPGCDEDRRSASTPTDPAPNPGCGPYPAQATSPYVLPYPPGTTYTVAQGNCSNLSHRAGSFDQYAYDFRMPNGSTLVAARAGTVTRIEERFTDGNRRPGEENFVIVVHDDGTAALYLHLTRNGALVDVGAAVAQGQTIALSGDTGNSTEPHLHFAVFTGATPLPVTFRNTRAHPNGLVAGQSYTAGAG